MQDEGSTLSAAVTSINFTGAGVTATGTSSVTVNVPAGTGGNVSNSGLGTGIAAALAINTGTAGAPVLFNGAGGTPLALALTNATGLPLSSGVTGILPVANGGTGATSSTGSGANVLATSPTLVTPALGTPSSGTLTSCTGLPIGTGVAGLGTGIATALAINTGTAGAPVLLGGAGGTPSSLALANAMGLPLGTGVTGLLPVANGGTGTATPGLVSGTNVTISGTWPNQMISATTAPGGFDPASPGAIGSTTAAAGSFTALSALTALLVPGAAAVPAAAGQIYRIANKIHYRDSSATEQVLLSGAGNLADLANAAAARGNLSAAGSGAIGSSGLTMNTNRILLRSTAGAGAVEEGAVSGGLVLKNGVLVPGEIIKLRGSNIGDTSVSTGNQRDETRIDRAFTVLGIWWNCAPTGMATASASDARPFIRTGAGTTSTGTKTFILNTAGNVVSLAPSVHTINATSSINGGTISGFPGDFLGFDYMSHGTGSSGHTLTFILEYT